MLPQKNMQSRSVKVSYFCYYLFNSPLFALYSLMPFILCKDLHASALQITILITIKPVVAMLSSYWSHYVSNGSHTLKNNIIWATCIGLLPTFFFPVIHDSWFLIAAFGLYFFAERAVIPAWMEWIKLSCDKEERSRLVSHGSLLMFSATALFPLLISPCLDKYGFSWKWIFPLLGIVSLARLPMLLSLSCNNTNVSQSTSTSSPYLKIGKQKLIHPVMMPWSRAWEILKSRPDFMHYQGIFFLGGLGLMVMQITVPHIVESNLHLSYAEIAIAVALCKGIGFALTTSLWSSQLHKTNIFKYCGIVTLFAAGSIGLILLSTFFPLAIYAAFLLYGVMQAGSHLSWELGGTIFSPKEDSSSYTSINVMLVGMRGCIGPIVGGILYGSLGSTTALIIAGLLCFSGATLGWQGRKKSIIISNSSYAGNV
jgi:predicted MFS family arabinose efflux permease